MLHLKEIPPATAVFGLLLLTMLFLVSCSEAAAPAASPAAPTEPAATATAEPTATPTPEPTATPTIEAEEAAGEPIADNDTAVNEARSDTLQNAGFEADEGRTSDITGWSSSGDVDADFSEPGGHMGNNRFSHWLATPYQVTTSQTITGLENGVYSLRLWYKSGGGQNEIYVALRDCGSPEVQVPIPQTSPTQWEQLEASIEVTNGECTIVLFSDANAGNWANFDDVEFVDASAPTPAPTPTATAVPLAEKAASLAVRGADISSLDKSEVMGGVYRYADGTAGDALEIMHSQGLNAIRLRVWVDPADGYHTLERILPMAQRAKDLDMDVLIDFHYSDFWADPGRQDKPAAWADYDLEQLKTAVYDHTAEVCNALVAQGTPPDIVQIGNEINGGMLWPEGSLDVNNGGFDDLAELLKQGIQAIKECSPETKIMLHLAEAGNYDLIEWWFGSAIDKGVDFDIIGLSYYPYWHGSLENLQSSLNKTATLFGKDIIVVEFAYPFTLANDDTHENIILEESQLTAGYPASPEGQQVMTRQIMNIVSQIPNDHGLGVFYWDGTWTAVDGNGWDPTDPSAGNAWENQALFNFDGEALPALSEFQGE